MASDDTPRAIPFKTVISSLSSGVIKDPSIVKQYPIMSKQPKKINILHKHNKKPYKLKIKNHYCPIKNY